MLKDEFNLNSAARVEWEFAAPLPHSNAAPTRAMTYNDDNQIATFNGQGVTYDADGNLTSGPLTNDTLAAYTYDARNRLTNAAGISYTYDPVGNRVALSNATVVTKFVVNPNAALSQVLLRVKNGVTNYYVYGLGLLYEADDAGNTKTYHYDYRGSTMAITDGAGNVTDRAEYSAYGSITYRTGTSDTPFLFNGRFGVQTDANGLLYMRARYYNPYICRFLNPDPLGFTGGLNFYAYADGNPISYLDPFGLWAGIDDLLFTGVGALIGVAGQGVADLVTGNFSGLGAYGVAAVSGGAGGEATLYTGPIGGGLAAGFTHNLFKQGEKILSGQQQNYNFLDAGKDTAIGGAIGAIPVPGIIGVNAGRGSFQAVEKQIVTKLGNGTIQNFSANTAGKIAVNEFYTSVPSIGFAGIQAAVNTPAQNGQSWLTTPSTFPMGNGFGTANHSNTGGK